MFKFFQKKCFWTALITETNCTFQRVVSRPRHTGGPTKFSQLLQSIAKEAARLTAEDTAGAGDWVCAISTGLRAKGIRGALVHLSLLVCLSFSDTEHCSLSATPPIPNI